MCVIEEGMSEMDVFETGDLKKKNTKPIHFSVKTLLTASLVIVSCLWIWYL